MAKYDEQLLGKLERAVEQFEQRTSVELVFVLAHRSSSYPDVPWKVGSFFAFLVLGLALVLPADFSPIFLLLDVLLGFAAGWALGRFAPGLTRLLVSTKRKKEQVRLRCHAAFSARGVTLTQDRSGLLIFVSWLEREVELRWDVGIERAVPSPEWNEARVAFFRARVLEDLPNKLDDGLKPLADVLSTHMPPASDNPNEIPNRPVVIG
ncbi:MAG: hypothetical protein JRF33_00020 [Deltaproteobacteria bacterium]|nr:hypothetical protein [Deltaproteobacteria bacterium]